MELVSSRNRFLLAILDALEAVTGEMVVAVVTQGEDDSLTPWTFLDDRELLADVLNGWVDHKVWNAPKSL